MHRPADAAAPIRLRVWDLPTRLFHWTLTLSVIASIVSAKIGGAATIWHFRLGELALALLVFRVLWGVFGGHWSRFGTFFYGPAALMRHLRGKPLPTDRFDTGHSPLASLSVWALLILLCAQVATGLVADDEIAHQGPLNQYVSTTTSSLATAYHQQIGQPLLIGLLILHVVAVLFHLIVKRRNLIAPMWHGDKPLASDAPTDLPASRDGIGTRLLALALFIGCAGLALWVARL